MSERGTFKTQAGNAPGLMTTGVLQRKCASCSNHTMAGSQCQECGKKRLQTKLQVNEPGDVYEQEADRIADQVMAAPAHHAVSGAPPRIQRFSGQSNGQMDAAPASVDQALVSPGRPLEPALRQDMGQRFGYDFSRVRVHSGAAAEQSARDVNAAAYTVGHNIVFGAGWFAPGTRQGRRLIAHELTHVVQQSGADGIGQGQYAPQTTSGQQLLAHELPHVMQQRAIGAPMVARQGLEQYKTSAVRITGADMETAAEGSYWEQKVSEVYLRVNVVPVKTRFDADSEERDAVLSTLWNMRPKTVTARTAVLANIPARKGATTSKALIYQFTFIPTARGEKLPRVEISFVAEGAAAASVASPAPAAGYSPPSLGLSHIGFPGKDIDKYWKAHPEEHKQVFNWIENVAPDPFEQVITTEVIPPAGSKKPPQKASFRVKGQKTGGSVQSLEIEFLGAIIATKADPPAGYHDKERLDLNIEKLQGQEKDKLGAITGLDKLPADEITPVKYVIWQYFKKGGARKAEVDVIVPIMTTSRRVFYTLRFKPGNDVEVERVAEEGTDAKAKQKSLNEMDVARVRGFTDNSKDPATLTTWLKKRYPSVTPQGKTVEELRQSVNTTMQADAGTPDWFKNNYDLTALPTADGSARLRDIHKVPAALTTDVQNFMPSDLNFVEFALQTMSELILALVKGVRLIRKTMGIAPINAAPKFKADASVAGIALQNGSEKSIAIFDKAKAGDDFLFLGGKGGVRQEATETAAHEFGHIVETQAGIQKAFLKFVAKHKIKPITWYAAKQPEKDFFTEAFAIHHTDPEWMRNNQPQLFDWFEILNKTGAPPPP